MKINVALSGGGARAVGHLGVLQVFMEEGIHPESISAVSGGSVVAVLLCDGYTPLEVLNIFSENIIKSNFNFKNFKEGLFSHNKLEKILKKYLRHNLLEELPVKLFISATDFHSGKAKIFDSGNIIERVIASSSIPILYPPVYIEGIPYVDGGLACNLPTTPFLKSDLKLIGIHVNPIENYHNGLGITDNIDRTVHLVLRESILNRIDECDVFIEPKGVEKFSLFDTDKAQEIFVLGYAYGKKLLGQEDFRKKIGIN